MDHNQSSGAQFRAVVPSQQGQQFIPLAPQHFRPVGQEMPSNVGMPGGQHQPFQFSQPMQQFSTWPTHPGHPAASSQAVPMPYAHPNRPVTSGPPQLQQTNPHFQPFPQMPGQAVPAGAAQPWMSTGSNGESLASSVQPSSQQPSVSSSSDLAVNAPNGNQQSSSDWQEHMASDGRRYYYNKRTKQSSWEKPLELMTPIERADASTVWKEFTTQDGKKYYYNKVTKQSKWSIPEELKVAREQAQQAVSQVTQVEAGSTSHGTSAVGVTMAETFPTAVTVGTSTSLSLSGVASSPGPVTPVIPAHSPAGAVSSSVPLGTQSSVANTASVHHPVATTTVLQSSASASADVAKTMSLSGSEKLTPQSSGPPIDGSSMQDTQEVKKSDSHPLEDKKPDDEPLVYATKLEAKNAFKALLESANVQSDWTWEQTMREIVNDRRYGALRTPGERKQAFNEYLGQRRKIEAEERRVRQKKAREEFTKMLEESKELTSSMKWSKAVSLFENDERFKAVERIRDREDLFESYIVELGRKEREKAAEDHRRNVAEYKKFLASCDFIKVNSPWRKIQDRLEDDERALCLEKLDRLLIFQDYIRDLEQIEEEQKKIHKEQLRRAERKNRDQFRKLLEEHVADGTLTAKTHWLDYCLKVKELPQYQAVAENTSGSTPKDLFEDVAEELENRYHDDKTQIKDYMKSEKITVSSTWTLEEFKTAISTDVNFSSVSDVNLKLLYDELIERAREKEEKEAKKRQRLADDFTELLHTYKEISASSSWEDCKLLVEESQEYRSIGDENFSREIFEEYVVYLQEKAKEKERKQEDEKAKKEEKEKRKERKGKEKEKEKDREREKGKERSKKDETDSENIDETEDYSYKEDKKKDKDRKRRKRHESRDDASSDKDEKEEGRKSHRHGSDRKKSRKHSYTPDSDTESRHKKHRKEHRDSSRRDGGGHEELEDGELGEVGEMK